MNLWSQKENQNRTNENKYNDHSSFVELKFSVFTVTTRADLISCLIIIVHFIF